MENALYEDTRIAEAAAVGVPDVRLGELVAAVVCLKKRHRNTVTEEELKQHCAKRYVNSYPL